jgi:hypothetical protein
MTTEPRTLLTGSAGARQLAQDLRRPMPDGFTWDYAHILSPNEEDNGSCGCAIRYAVLTYPDVFPRNKPSSWYEELVAHLNMNDKEGRGIFLILHRHHGLLDPSEVTPEMVADAIDDWLRSRGEPTSEEIKE